MLRKGVYPYEYVDDWEEFNETSIRGRNKLLSSGQSFIQ